MELINFTEASLSTRILAAVVTLIVSSGIAAAVFVSVMMALLFSTESQSATGLGPNHFDRITIIVVTSLIVAVIVPPVMILFRYAFFYCLIPAGLGLGVAGCATLWFVLTNPGFN
ncbi:MAG: hypothetical protein AAF623_16940 [Planctomycetota bacterium]